jgi:PRTRC genetic system ThiF family protein
MKWHYLEQRIASTQHKITICVVGCGGTGSHVLTGLGMINKAMIALGRPALHIKAYDPDIVTETNIGRQSFSPADLGQNKAITLISRLNRYYGTNWLAYPDEWKGHEPMQRNRSITLAVSNIVISCVDSVSSREKVSQEIYLASLSNSNHFASYNNCFYWLDIGNGSDYGQVLLSTVRDIKQPKGRGFVKRLPDFFKEFPNAKDDPEEPTCSVAVALSRQDLFINKILADHACNMLWTLLTKFRINHRGIYLNLGTGKTSAIML